jgi:hypothetical protein
MEIAIATILTTLTVTGLVIVGLGVETVKPVNFKERIESPTEICIVTDNNEIECMQKTLSYNEQK